MILHNQEVVVFLNNLKFEWTKLVNKVHSLFNLNEPLKAYSQFVHMLATKEIFVAQNKANFLFAADVMNKINATVPWQVNKWSDSEVEHFKQEINDNDGSVVTTDKENDSNAAEDEDQNLISIM
jgi:hypothetical protein